MLTATVYARAYKNTGDLDFRAASGCFDGLFLIALFGLFGLAIAWTIILLN
jgi:hypothetical protein